MSETSPSLSKWHTVLDLVSTCRILPPCSIADLNIQGAINWLFALPAIKHIDTLGRRKLLLMTLPCMAITMLGAGLAGFIEDQKLRVGITALFLFCKSRGLAQAPCMKC